jgi:hypothetical protein
VGGLPRRGLVVEGVKGVKYAPMPPGMYENGEKMGGFVLFLAFKLPKTPFCIQKYVTRYTPKMFFKEYINFTIFCVLRHCGVIPLQSIGSHICPLPPGLGIMNVYSIR